MTQNTTRRGFLRSGGAAILGAGLLASGVARSSLFAETNTIITPERSKSGRVLFQLGLASYSLREFDQATAIKMSKRAGLEKICFKDMHLKMDATDEQCAQAAKACEAGGIDLYACGVVYMRNAEQVENAFRYAKAAGMRTIVGVPNHDLLDLVEKKVKETGITIAIHNHGPGDKLYPNPESVYEKVKNLDPRIGLCIDMGHTVRNGADPAEDILRFKDRLFDFHIKDMAKAAPEGRACICGRGVVDFPAIFAALNEVKYDKVVAFEYEADGKDPLPGLMESVGYIRGILRMM